MTDEALAGGVVFRRVGPSPQFLLVTARRSPADWIFPKGHVDGGETPADAAKREVAEEAGVVARVVTRLDEVEFSVGKRSLRVEFFLLEYEGDVPTDEGRQVAWLSYDDAMRSLSFAEARGILEMARAQLP